MGTEIIDLQQGKTALIENSETNFQVVHPRDLTRAFVILRYVQSCYLQAESTIVELQCKDMYILTCETNKEKRSFEPQRDKT